MLKTQKNGQVNRRKMDLIVLILQTDLRQLNRQKMTLTMLKSISTVKLTGIKYIEQYLKLGRTSILTERK